MARPLLAPSLYFRREGPAVSRQFIPSAATILKPATILYLSNTSGGAVIMTSTPTLMDGVDGSSCLLVNISANNITIQDQGTLPNSNLRLSAAAIVMGTRDSVGLLYSADIGDWIQITVTNVI